MSATSQLLQNAWNNRQLQTSQPAACEFNPQLGLLAARALKLLSAAAENGAVFLSCIRLFSGNFAVGVNLLDLDLSNNRFQGRFDQNQLNSAVADCIFVQ